MVEITYINTAILILIIFLTTRPTLITSEQCDRQKQCPDFKDKSDEVHCCPSTIEVNSFYCCDAKRLKQLDERRRAELRRQFFSRYLALLICTSVGVSLFLGSVLLIFCYSRKDCPLARRKSRKMLADGNLHLLPMTGRFAIVPRPKPPSFDAPPPYMASRSRTEWHCLLENEANRSSIFTS